MERIQLEPAYAGGRIPGKRLGPWPAPGGGSMAGLQGQEGQSLRHSRILSSLLLALLLFRKQFFLLCSGLVHVFMLSCSVVSDSLRLRRLQPPSLLCPWDYSGKNTAVGCHFLLQGIFLTQGMNPRLGLLHWQVNSLLLGHLGSSTNFNKDFKMVHIYIYFFFFLKL